ncbi:ABC transporter ATP-binding protein [Bradyrhizobium mercantei]|uniref:ABC transporter ATP-binding protein n=1 Tax=Bradyrhizobium mercantei TaxID=1904807 RepID=UPI001FD8A6FF|nr:ABC transporter ATP-binding protein [Bradyrhizobium mercantei]
MNKPANVAGAAVIEMPRGGQASAKDASKCKVRFSGVHKHFKTGDRVFTAIDGVSLEIPDGSFFVIVGPSGCGKTTLLRMLAGLERPSVGTVECAQTAGKSPRMSMVFQGDAIFPWMTVWDNAAYALKLRAVPEAEIAEIVGHYLDRTGLTKFAKAYPHQLSGGMRQRVSIARAFANDPEVLLMDEPFSALDEQNKTLLQEELLRIWDETKKTVLFITHSVDEAVTLGDKIMVMTAHPGRIKAVVDVPFERPRNVIELRAQPAYGEMVYQIWGHLREEVQQARLQSESQMKG